MYKSTLFKMPHCWKSHAKAHIEHANCNCGMLASVVVSEDCFSKKSKHYGTISHNAERIKSYRG